MKTGISVLFVLVFLHTLRLDSPAYAYLDPGTGSILIQLLLGGFAGVLVVGKLYWYRLKVLFGFETPQNPTRESSSDDDAK